MVAAATVTGAMSQKTATAALATSNNGVAGRSPARVVSSPRAPAPQPEPRIDLVRDVLLALVRRDGRDLTARQLSAFMIVYTRDEVQTVSSLADLMNISRPGVTRVMDRLVQYDLLAREEDREDRRRVLARRTARGLAFHRDLATIARGAAEGRVGLGSIAPTAPEPGQALRA
jgi:DNA-binding MarR family transcriptional regulator